MNETTPMKEVKTLPTRYVLFFMDADTHAIYTENGDKDTDNFLPFPEILLDNLELIPKAVLNAGIRLGFDVVGYVPFMPVVTSLEYSLKSNEPAVARPEGAAVVIVNTPKKDGFLSIKKITQPPYELDDDYLDMLLRLMRYFHF